MAEKDDCIFCKIVAGEIPCHKLSEGEHTIAIMDAFPATRGHALVLTKKHREDVLEMTADELAETNIELQKLSAAIQKTTDCPAFNLLNNKGRLAGQMVFHAHFHIIPRYEDDAMQVKFSKIQMTDEQKASLSEEIKNNL